MKDRISETPGRFSAEVSAEEFARLQAGERFHISLVRDDDPSEEGTPYNKASVLPDDVAEFIGVTDENFGDPTPADAFRGLGVNIQGVSRQLEEHQVNQDNPHKVTATQAGAAPAEFGLGESSSRGENWNSGYQNGFFRSNQNSPDGSWWYGLVCREYSKNQSTTEIAFSVDTNGMVSEARRGRSSAGKWAEWEYVNPPMVEGVEYRTTERWKGRPVYTKLIDCGTAENGKIVDLQDIVHFVRVSGWITTEDGNPLFPIPHFDSTLDGGGNVWLTPNYFSGLITLNCGSGIPDAYTFSVQIWYVK